MDMLDDGSSSSSSDSERDDTAIAQETKSSVQPTPTMTLPRDKISLSSDGKKALERWGKWRWEEKKNDNNRQEEELATVVHYSEEPLHHVAAQLNVKSVFQSHLAASLQPWEYQVLQREHEVRMAEIDQLHRQQDFQEQQK